MKLATLISVVGLMAVGLLATRGDAAPGAADSSTSTEMRVQTFKPYNYTYVSTKTSLKKLKEAIGELTPKLTAAIESGKIHPTGGAIFTYHGMTGDPTKEFTLDFGIMTKDGDAAPEGFTTDKVGAEQCASVIYSGPLNGLKQAYGKLFGEIGQNGLQATDITREVYLYWEDEGSENNVVQIRAALSATGM
jgi:effector-binding domain-containing protein